MKWYFASRTKHRELVKNISNILEKQGHEIVFNWTVLEGLVPYNQNIKKCNETAQKISSAIPKADVFVLISDSEGTDMFVELGMAIANYEQNKKTKIYIVGEHNKRSLMHLHPSITHLDSLKDVFLKECPELIQHLNPPKPL